MLTPSYIQYADNSSVVAASNLQTTDTLFQAEGEVVGGAMVGKKGGCNISFDSAFDIDFNIPEFNFFETAAEFDTSLFDKIDQLSGEIAGINNMLIDAIADMDCCEIADSYNGTIVPFFKFFADTEGDSVMDIIITMAEVITAVKAIVEVLECMMPLLPGNPWVTKDVDFLSWIYGFWKESGAVLDKFFSGEFLDMLIGPVHDIRKQLQACLGYGESHLLPFNEVKIGSGSQIAKLAAVAAKDGNQITAAQILKPPAPVKPIAAENGGAGVDFVKAMEAYETAEAAYKVEIARYDTVVKSVNKQTEVQKNINANLAIATQTQNLFKLSTDGLCGCIADVLGLQDISIIPMPTKTSSDMTMLIGKTINGLTNKQAGTASKDRPGEEKLTVKEEDLKSKKTVNAILNSGESKGKTEKAKKVKEEQTKLCPYTAAKVPVGQGVIAETCPVIELSALSGQPAIKKANDDKEDYQKDMNTLLVNVGAKTKQDQEAFKKAFLSSKKEAEAIIVGAQSALDVSTVGFSQETKDIVKINNSYLEEDLYVAEIIYANSFGTFTAFDFIADPEELNFTSLWLTQDILDMMYSGIGPMSVSTKDLGARAMAELPPELQSIPFPPSTPPQNIINDLKISTIVEQDTRKEINYFNAGFVRQGEPLWRNFNVLDIDWNQSSIDMGAIAPDKTRSHYAAIFPNDQIGNDAMVKYVRDTYPSISINSLIEEELIYPNDTNISYVSGILSSIYNVDSSLSITSVDDDTLFNIIQTIANTNGFEQGDLWVRTRYVQEDVQFGTSQNGDAIEYTLGYTGNIFESLVVSGFNGLKRNITQEEKILVELAYGIQSANVASLMMGVSNKYIGDRAQAYKKEMQHYLQESASHLALDKLNESLNNSIASMVQTEVNLTIPCTCDGIMCMVINQIIQKVLSAFEQMIEYVIDTIVDFIIPDWIKDIMSLIQEYINCYKAVFGIPAKIAAVHEEAESLREDLKGRVNMYPMDLCFVPDDVFPDKPVVDKPVSSEHVDYLPGSVCAPNPNDTWGGSCPQTSSCSSPSCSQSSCNVSCSGPCGIGIPSPVTCCVTGPCNVTEGCAGTSNPCLSSTCNYMSI